MRSRLAGELRLVRLAGGRPTSRPSRTTWSPAPTRRRSPRRAPPGRTARSSPSRTTVAVGRVRSAIRSSVRLARISWTTLTTMFDEMTASETSASTGRPTSTSSDAQHEEDVVDEREDVLADDLAVGPGRGGGAVLPWPAARRDAASASVRPVAGVAATIASAAASARRPPRAQRVGGASEPTAGVEPAAGVGGAGSPASGAAFIRRGYGSGSSGRSNACCWSVMGQRPERGKRRPERPTGRPHQSGPTAVAGPRVPA